MRGAIRIAVVVTVLALPAVAVAAAGGQTRAINCNREQYKPAAIILTCGDAGIWLGKLKWTRWTATEARATGTYYENTCTPTCSAGHTVSRSVKVTLEARGACPGHVHPVFGLAHLTYPRGTPPHAYHWFSFDCPA
jgi:hypothetical protein